MAHPIHLHGQRFLVLARNGVPSERLVWKDTAIVPVGGHTNFTKFYGRLESSEKRNISLGEFNGRDGTRFDLRVVKPKLVHVTAKDLTGKDYDVELPWE